MSEELVFPSYIIRLAILGALLLLLLIAWNRIKDTFIGDWSHELQVSKLRKRPILMTIMKMYSNVQSSSPEQLSEDVRNELLVNLGLAYDRPTAYFVRLREEPRKLKQYLKDDELVEFFYSPHLWANRQLGEEYSFFEFFKKRQTGDEFLQHLERILDNFEKVIMSVRTEEKARDPYSIDVKKKSSQA
jgi:hypothetical protein